MSVLLSVDPLAESQPNKMPYHYVSNNPMNRIDPTGMLDTDYYNQKGDHVKYVDDGIPQYVYEFESIGLQVWVKGREGNILTIIASSYYEEN